MEREALLDWNRVTGRGWLYFDCPAAPSRRDCIRVSLGGPEGGSEARGSAAVWGITFPEGGPREGCLAVLSNSIEVKGVDGYHTEDKPAFRVSTVLFLDA